MTWVRLRCWCGAIHLYGCPRSAHHPQRPLGRPGQRFHHFSWLHCLVTNRRF